MLNLNSLYNGDCLEVMNQIDDKSIDLICTDLPYGQTARNKWDTVIPFCDYVKIKGNTYYENDVFKISGVLNKNMEYTKNGLMKTKRQDYGLIINVSLRTMEQLFCLQMVCLRLT